MKDKYPRLNTRGAVTLQTVIITAVLALAAAGIGIIIYNTIGGKTENLATTSNLVKKFTATEKAVVDVLAELGISDFVTARALRSPFFISTAQISGHFSHSCAIRGPDKEVWCWGGNNKGRLGDGTKATRHTLVQIPGLSNIQSVAVGERFSCALLKNGAVKCLGGNDDGQLGNENRDPSSIPLTVTGITGTDPNTVPRNPSQIAISITAGYTHACAILEDNTAKCWGDNRDGQLGNENTGLISRIPVQVLESGGTPLRDIVSIAAGWHHTCAAISDGTVKCWGRNEDGQLGDENRDKTEDALYPISATGLGTRDVLAVSVSAGWHHTCATLENGTARCWGKDEDRQIGTTTGIDMLRSAGSGRPDVRTPTKVYQDFVSPTGTELTSIDSISPGDDHTCSLRTVNQVKQVWCWGNNESGQLGIGNFKSGDARYMEERSSSMKIAAPVLGDLDDDPSTNNVALDNIKAVSSGQWHSCAVRGDDDEVWCWGYNSVFISSSLLTDFRLGVGADQTQYNIATKLTFSSN